MDNESGSPDPGGAGARTSLGRARRALVSTGALLSLDALCVGLALLAGRAMSPSAYLGWFGLLMLVLQGYEGVYTKRVALIREHEMTVRGMTIALGSGLLFAEIGDSHQWLGTILITWLVTFALLPATRRVGKCLLSRWGLIRRRVLVLGAAKTGELFQRAVDREPGFGYEIVGFLDDDPAKQGEELGTSFGHPVRVLSPLSQAAELIARLGVDDVVVAIPGLPPQSLVALVRQLHPLVQSVQVIPDLFGLPVVTTDLSSLFLERALVVRIWNPFLNGWAPGIKRGFDIAVTILLLPVVLPFMALISLAIKLDSSGSAIYSAPRIGLGGRPFLCYKFRTMRSDTDRVLLEYLEKNPDARAEWNSYRKLRTHDPRVTRVGRFLRKWSLDEIPQLLNVLKGNMSLVGPRPYLTWEEGVMGAFGPAILQAKPGITGLWQVMGRNEIPFEERLRLEAWYVQNWSFWLDCSILIQTVTVVLMARGAY